MTKPKLAFFCLPGADNFIGDIVQHLSDKYEVRRFAKGMLTDLAKMLKWSDVSWFEWCDHLLIHASKLDKRCRMICRLHSYESMTNLPSQVNWSKVDDLVFVAPHIRDILKLQIPDIEDKVSTHVIPNGVDMDKCRFTEREKGYNLAYIGYINYKKNPAMLLQCMRYLVDIDDRYVLHIAGKYQDLRYQLYLDHMIKAMGLEENIIFHGWVDDIVSWLDDKHFVVCTSLLESFGYGIAEAMACGLKPILHNFVGAKEIYPEECLFNTVVEFALMMIADEYTPAVYRRYIEDNYSLARQLESIDNLLNPAATSGLLISHGGLECYA